MKKIMKFLLIVFPFLLFSCGDVLLADAVAETMPEKPVIQEEEKDENPIKNWTIVLYMAADNNLESFALADLNEMESAELDESVTVLALLDRAKGYDETNGDWTDTRLFRVTKNLQENNACISSERLECEELGLKTDEETELDMANPKVLEGLLKFARSSYPAEKYALIFWGHGTGWRGENERASGEMNKTSPDSFRAVAIDGTSDSYMTISQVNEAVKSGMVGEKISIIGFDTCFGMCVEAAYELCESADFMLGTPALVPESGWNYTLFLTNFLKSQKSVSDLISSVSEQYAQTYRNYGYASFSCVELSRIPSAVDKFSEFSKKLAQKIDTKPARDEIFSVFSSEASSYMASSWPTDFYVDVADLLEKLTLHAYSESKDALDAFADSIVSSWSASGKKVSMGLFFCVYQGAGIPQPSHPSMYVNGSRDTSMSRFVQNVSAYVPTTEKTGSLLDKLFYTSYN